MWYLNILLNCITITFRNCKEKTFTFFFFLRAKLPATYFFGRELVVIVFPKLYPHWLKSFLLRSTRLFEHNKEQEQKEIKFRLHQQIYRDESREYSVNLIFLPPTVTEIPRNKYIGNKTLRCTIIVLD